MSGKAVAPSEPKDSWSCVLAIAESVGSASSVTLLSSGYRFEIARRLRSGYVFSSVL